MSSTTEAAVTLGRLRRWLLAILVFGMVGTTADLLLQKHYEDATQLIPLILIGFGLIVVTWHLLGRSRSSLMILQLVMVLFVASGGLGMFLHYRANLGVSARDRAGPGR